MTDSDFTLNRQQVEDIFRALGAIARQARDLATKTGNEIAVAVIGGNVAAIHATSRMCREQGSKLTANRRLIEEVIRPFEGFDSFDLVVFESKAEICASSRLISARFASARTACVQCADAKRAGHCPSRS